jgi:hypothetical protein
MRGNSKFEIRGSKEGRSQKATNGSLAGRMRRIAAQAWPEGPLEISQPRSGWFCGLAICPGGTWDVSTVPSGRNTFPCILPDTLWLANFRRRFAAQGGGAA